MKDEWGKMKKLMKDAVEQQDHKTLVDVYSAGDLCYLRF